jgi:hypothetical protein
MLTNFVIVSMKYFDQLISYKVKKSNDDKFSSDDRMFVEGIIFHRRNTNLPQVIKKKQSRYRPGVAPQGSRKLRFPDFMTTAQDGGKFVSPTHWPHLPSGNSPGTHFC